MKPLFRITGLLLIAWLAFCVRMDAPFFGHHEVAAIWLSAAVRNFDLYGALPLGLVPIINRGIATPDTYIYYVNHPPMIVWLTALLAQIAGLSNLTVRFVAAALSLIGVAGVYAIAKRMFDDRTAFWGAIFYVFTPMILYYGRSPNHEPLTLTIMTLYAAILLSWYRSPRRWHLPALIGLSLLAGFSSWAAMLAVALLTVSGFMLAGARRLPLIIPGLALIAGLALMLALYERQWSGAVAQLIGSFGYRTSDYTYYNQAAVFNWGFSFASVGRVALVLHACVVDLRNWGPDPCRTATAQL